MPEVHFADLPPRPCSRLAQLSVAAGIMAISLAVAIYCYEQTRKRKHVRPRTCCWTRP